jgi:S-adenosylmethionine-diacylgycerolhomoserine-N-methlytransferase
VLEYITVIVALFKSLVREEVCTETYFFMMTSTTQHIAVGDIRERYRRRERHYRSYLRFYRHFHNLLFFGRNKIINKIPGDLAPRKILEIGCGSGKNLLNMCKKYPGADITGIDFSKTMLNEAITNLGYCTPQVKLLHRRYHKPLHNEPAYDLILLSYTLSTMPDWKKVVNCIYQDLKDDGVLVYVDFHSAGNSYIKNWLEFSQSRTSEEQLSWLETRFEPEFSQIKKAYCGLWKYSMLIGKKRLPRCLD